MFREVTLSIPGSMPTHLHQRSHQAQYYKLFQHIVKLVCVRVVCVQGCQVVLERLLLLLANANFNDDWVGVDTVWTDDSSSQIWLGPPQGSHMCVIVVVAQQVLNGVGATE